MIYVVAHDGGYEGHSLPYLAFETADQARAWVGGQTECWSIAAVPVYPELPRGPWFNQEAVMAKGDEVIGVERMTKAPDQPGCGDACCVDMAEELARECDMHDDRWACPDNVIAISDEGHYGLLIHDGGLSMYEINYCPWCGSALVPQTGPVNLSELPNTDAAQVPTPESTGQC